MDFYIEIFFDQPIKIKGMDNPNQHKTKDNLFIMWFNFFTFKVLLQKIKVSNDNVNNLNEKCFILKSLEIYHCAPSYLTYYLSD